MRYFTTYSGQRVAVTIEQRAFELPEFDGTVDSLRGHGTGQGRRLRCHLHDRGEAVVDRTPDEIEEESDAPADTRQDIAERIISSQGCELMPGSNGHKVLVVQPRYREGDPQDARRIRRCRIMLWEAGISSIGWLS